MTKRFTDEEIEEMEGKTKALLGAVKPVPIHAESLLSILAEVRELRHQNAEQLREISALSGSLQCLQEVVRVSDMDAALGAPRVDNKVSGFDEGGAR